MRNVKPSVVPDLSESLPHVRLGKAQIVEMTITAGLGRDTLVLIRYDGSQGLPGRLYIKTRDLGVPDGEEREMSRGELQALKELLKGHHGPKPNIDPVVRQAFSHFANLILHTPQPSSLFDQARFASIEKDRAGAIIATLGFGIDSMATVSDLGGKLTFEQHPVPGPTGQPHPLSAADRASLVINLEKFLTPPDPTRDLLWQDLMTDAQRKHEHEAPSSRGQA